MAFNIPGVPSSLDAKTMGNFDLGAALKSGLQNYGLAEEARYKPKTLAEELLGKHLTNKINEVKSKYAEDLAKAQLAKAQRGPVEPAEIRTLKWLLANKDQFDQGGDLNADHEESTAPVVGEGQPSYVSSLTGEQPRPHTETNKPDYAKSIYKYALNKNLGIPNELPHERMEREINTSNLKEQNKLDIKQAQKLRDAAKDLQLAGLDVEGIHDILTGPDSLGTGITKTLIGKLGWGSEKLGQFNERALRLQTQMTKALSSRGGEGAAKIVQSGKPTTWKSTSENLGITNAYADRIKNEFDLLNQEYRAITGKDLPYTLPEYVHNIGHKIIPTKQINGRTFELKNGKWHERKVRV